MKVWVFWSHYGYSEVVWEVAFEDPFTNDEGSVLHSARLFVHDRASLDVVQLTTVSCNFSIDFLPLHAVLGEL